MKLKSDLVWTELVDTTCITRYVIIVHIVNIVNICYCGLVFLRQEIVRGQLHIAGCAMDMANGSIYGN